jgi:hypothetical protein
MAAPIVAAYADALDRVFLYAVPVAVVGFILALTLKQVPLRDTSAGSGTDMGDGFAMPVTESSEQVLAGTVGRLLRQGSGLQLRNLADHAGGGIDVGGLWALIQVYRFGQAAGQARLGDVAEHVRVPREILEPAFDRLVTGGYAQRNGDRFWLTPAGARQVDFARTRMVDWLTARLAESPELPSRPQREDVQAALEKIAQNVLVQRNWSDDTTQPIRMMRPPRIQRRKVPRPPRPTAQLPPPPDATRPIPVRAPVSRTGATGTEPPTTRLRAVPPPRPGPRRRP